jgi:hypothetical protein
MSLGVTFKDEGSDEDRPFGPVLLIHSESESPSERAARDGHRP